ncbi:hypothetical protein B0H34DRAFT_799067 [Crassisporium funariophilum]|nr:hypothetical protein B0H34DRAFT_799067 [Crassisporium funariophilum]
MGKELMPIGYEQLCKASEAFLGDASFGHPQVEDVMETVFGSYQGRSDDLNAKAWSAYWTGLAVYEENQREGLLATIPKIPAYPGNECTVSEDVPSPTFSQLMEVDDDGDKDTPVVTKDKHARDMECHARKLNGNKSGRVAAHTGAKFDALAADIVIESREKNSRRAMTTTYYCIGCNNSWKNNASTRSYPHAKKCESLARHFPATHKKVLDALGKQSTALILSGNGKAPAVRKKKRKVAE